MPAEKVLISVLGSDRPGIIAAVSQILSENECNIEDVNQTILQSEFAGVFMASLPEGLSMKALESKLTACLQPMGLAVLVKPVKESEKYQAPPSQPFVMTTFGPDRLGLVAGMTEVMARFGVNIKNLRAAFRGGSDPRRNVMIYEVDIPLHIDQQAFRKALRQRAEDLGLDLSLQHRDIFEAVHRI